MYQSKNSVIIVAAGSGSRMGAEVPKQFLLLKEKPILMYTIELFNSISEICEIIVVLSPLQIDNWKQICENFNFSKKHTVVAGGASRTESVKNGLDCMQSGEGVVLIHDGVRPFVSEKMVEDAIKTAQKHRAAVPVVDLIDSIRFVESESENCAVDRSRYKCVQTPQAFDKELILEAYKVNGDKEFSDDAAIVESIGAKISFFDGDRKNIKITTVEDLKFSNFVINS
ncbi:MAG: 2-C-methyl-D-erythritol 4-phosphate cytidylyltransferase [Rikenellaceae bacterium]